MFSGILFYTNTLLKATGSGVKINSPQLSKILIMFSFIAPLIYVGMNLGISAAISGNAVDQTSERLKNSYTQIRSYAPASNHHLLIFVQFFKYSKPFFITLVLKAQHWRDSGLQTEHSTMV